MNGCGRVYCACCNRVGAQGWFVVAERPVDTEPPAVLHHLGGVEWNKEAAEHDTLKMRITLKLIYELITFGREMADTKMKPVLRFEVHVRSPTKGV